jgi:hypothetical protein
MANKVNIKISGDDFKGIKNLAKNLAKLKSLQAKVGIWDKARYPETGERVIDVAMLHEFGSNHARTFNYKGKNITVEGIPQRSFLRVPILTHKKRVIYSKEVMKAMVIIALHEGDVKRPLQFMADNAYDIVQEAFETRGFGRWLPNMNKEYVKLKGSSTPLIDTGLLRRLVDRQVTER